MWLITAFERCTSSLNKSLIRSILSTTLVRAIARDLGKPLRGKAFTGAKRCFTSLVQQTERMFPKPNARVPVRSCEIMGVFFQAVGSLPDATVTSVFEGDSG